MKPTSRLRYADKIDRVIAHLEQTEDADLDQLASVASLSPHHFHRIYRLMTGETVAETVQRVRLGRSVPELQDESVSITAAAGASGFSTSQSFARAFRSVTGGTASELRAGRTGLLERLLKPTVSGDGVPMPVEIVSLEPFRLLAIRNVGAYEELNKSYEALFGAVFEELTFETLRGIWGVWHEDPRFTPADQLHFDCAIDVGGHISPGAPVEVMEMAGGSYARQRHVGDYASLHETIDALYGWILVESKHAFADRPMIVNYVDDPETRPAAELRSDVYVPLEG